MKNQPTCLLLTFPYTSSSDKHSVNLTACTGHLTITVSWHGYHCVKWPAAFSFWLVLLVMINNHNHNHTRYHSDALSKCFLHQSMPSTLLSQPWHCQSAAYMSNIHWMLLSTSVHTQFTQLRQTSTIYDEYMENSSPVKTVHNFIIGWRFSRVIAERKLV